MSKELTTTAPKARTVRELLDSMRDQFKVALPKSGLTADRFVRVALTAINKQPKLLQCTKESLLACLMDCAQLGIETDGRLAHLVPYGQKCTLIVDYKGIATLVRRSGEVAAIHADVVYDCDEFEYSYGTNQFLRHRPAITRPEGAKRLCVYSFVRLKNGEDEFDVMDMAGVEKVRARSKTPNDGPWKTDYDEMCKKSVFRRHSKWLPLSPALQEAITKDDDPLTEQERFAAARKVSDGIEYGMPFTPTAEEPTVEEPPAETGTDEQPELVPAEKQEKPPPEKATAHETLRALLTSSVIGEDKFLEMARDKDVFTGKQTAIDDLPVQTAKMLVKNFAEIVGL